MRQTCIAPYLVFQSGLLKAESNGDEDDIEGLIPSSVYEADIYLSGYSSTKIAKIIEICKDIVAKGEKVLIYSIFSKALQLFPDALKIHDIRSMIFTGSVKSKNRLSLLTKFQTDPDEHVLCVHYRVGGKGLT